MARKFDPSHQFTCEHCGQRVPWMRWKGHDGYARDHCPHCLWSKHIAMGEEAGYPPCDGMMRGVAVDDGNEIVLRCLGCGFSYRRPTDDYLFSELDAGRSVPATIFTAKPGSKMADPMVRARFGNG